jgi:hypothetical protein
MFSLTILFTKSTSNIISFCFVISENVVIACSIANYISCKAKRSSLVYGYFDPPILYIFYLSESNYRTNITTGSDL